MITKHPDLRDLFMEITGIPEDEMLELIEQHSSKDQSTRENCNTDFSNNPVADELGEGVQNDYYDQEY